MILFLLVTVLITIAALVYVTLAELPKCKRDTGILRNTVTEQEVGLAQSFRTKLTYRRFLATAEGVLKDLRDQNHGDPTYEVWARKRAADTLQYLERGKAKL